VICKDRRILDIVPVRLFNYAESLEIAFDRTSEKHIVSSWKDALSNTTIDKRFLDYIQVPEHGVFSDKRVIEFNGNLEEVIANIWSIGGNRGWYFGNWMWNIRGVIDKLSGGVGLRRGRRSETDLKTGDALDFWRVLVADRTQGRLLLYAEMRLPGEAWLEFKVKPGNPRNLYVQTATFRPLGLWGRLYWYAVLPFHGIIFPGMARNIVHYSSRLIVASPPASNL
jgi:hypothetical protein